MTRHQKRALANLVLAHGYDILTEFWGEVTENWEDRPPYEEARPVIDAWHRHLIDLSDKAMHGVS